MTELVKLLTVDQVADLCQVSARTVLRAIRDGRLRASRLGARGAYRIHPGDVEAWRTSAVVRPRRESAAPLEIAHAAPARRRGAARRGRLVVTEGMGRT